MGKLKTNKCVAKRFKITKSGKLLCKKAGQDHFNSREPGKVTRNKRRLHSASPANERNIKAFLRLA